MNYKKILVALDNSIDAETVIASALKSAEDGAEIHMVTVVQPLSNVYGGLIWSPAMADTQTLEGSLIESAKKQLLELGQRYILNLDHIHVELGSAAPKIREVAEEISADLIVIGTHGRQGLGLVLGSTANSVLHGVNTDVLVVRLPEDD